MLPWATRIARAEKRGFFNEDDKHRASRWLQCAVGEHRGQYAEDASSSKATPVSSKLTDHGIELRIAVFDNEFAKAWAAHKRIAQWMRRYGRREAS